MRFDFVFLGGIRTITALVSGQLFSFGAIRSKQPGSSSVNPLSNKSFRVTTTCKSGCGSWPELIHIFTAHHSSSSTRLDRKGEGVRDSDGKGIVGLGAGVDEGDT